MKTAPGQLDMFAEIEHAEAEARLAATPRCMFDSPARGLAARTADLAAWCDEWGDFGCLVRSHAWSVRTYGIGQTSRCQATALCCDVRRDLRSSPEGLPACDCVDKWDELLYRGACTGCDWEGDPRTRENPAVEDAMDHAWPGWRDVPVVKSWPASSNDKANQQWLAKVVPLYPAGWIENGGPVRTQRDSPLVGRHHDGGTPFRGFDMGVIEPAPNQEDK